MTYYSLLRKYASVITPEDQVFYTQGYMDGMNLGKPSAARMRLTGEQQRVYWEGFEQGIKLHQSRNAAVQASVDPEEAAERRLGLAVEMARRQTMRDKGWDDRTYLAGKIDNRQFDPDHIDNCDFCRTHHPNDEWNWHGAKNYSHIVRFEHPEESTSQRYAINAQREIPPLYQGEVPKGRWNL